MAKIPKVSKKYTSGLSESTAAKRKAEIRKRVRGKKSFEPLAGDSKPTKRKSKYTQAIKKSGIRQIIIDETSKGKGKTQERYISAVSRVTKIPRKIIDAVYKKGLAAWAVGHRPGATQAQWARARVYSFLSKGKTTESADLQLFLEAKKALKEKGKRFDFGRV